VTTGAANDLEKVTSMAREMVTRFGMSEELGPRVLGHSASMPFLGREMGQQPDYSEEVARQIDAEMRRIIEEAHERARQVLLDHREDLNRISQILIARETIEREEFEALLDGRAEEEVFRAKDERCREEIEGQKVRRPRSRRTRTAPVPAPTDVPSEKAA
jgi:cell division protease FtsH